MVLSEFSTRKPREKSLNYQDLVPVLVNAVIDQQNEIERLKKRIYK